MYTQTHVVLSTCIHVFLVIPYKYMYMTCTFRHQPTVWGWRVGWGSGRRGSKASSRCDHRCTPGCGSWCMHASYRDLQGRLRSFETTCPLSSQACLWSGWHPIFSEWHPAPHAALSWCGHLAPLLPRRGWGLSTGLPDPDGHLACHLNAFQSADSSDPGAKWDFRLAEETAFAQILPCL